MKIVSVEDVYFSWRSMSKKERVSNVVFWIGLVGFLFVVSRL